MDCLWDGVLHAAVMLRLRIVNLLMCARFVKMPALGIKLCAFTDYSLFHSHAQVLTFNDTTW